MARCFRILYLGFFFLLAVSLSVRAGELPSIVTEDFKVEAKVTDHIVFGNEVQFLIINRKYQPLHYIISFHKDARTCLPDLGKLDNYEGNLIPSVDYFNNVFQSSGDIAPKGWAHRAFTIPKSAIDSPCRLKFNLTLDGEEEIIEIRVGQPLDKSGYIRKSKRPRVALESQFDPEYFLNPDFLRLRVKIENLTGYPGNFYMTKRSLTCGNQQSVDFVLDNSIPKEMDVGPIHIDAGEWGFFVQDFQVMDAKSAKDCFLNLEISIHDPVRTVVTEENQFIKVGEMKIRMKR